MHAKDSLKTDKSQEADNVSAALALAAQGIAVFPVGPDKRPLVKGWQDKATTDPDQIKAWWRDRPDAMPAIPTGKRNGFAVLDVDRKNGKDGLAELAALGLDVETLSDTQVATAGDGRHIYLEWPEGMGNSAAGLPPGLDVRGEGGYVVAPGAVNGKGVYRLLKGSLTAKLPQWPEALRTKPKVVDAGEARPTGLPWPVFVEAVRAVPNDIKDRETWVARLASIHAESGGNLEGNDLAHEWSAKHDSYDPTETDHVYYSFTADRDGGATGWRFISEAERRGWSHPAVTELRKAEAVACLNNGLEEDKQNWVVHLPAEESAEIMRRSVDKQRATVMEKQRTNPNIDPEMFDLIWGEPQAPNFGLILLNPDQCADSTPVPYVVKGLIAEGNLVTIVGQPGAGKSVLTPYLGYMVALGEPAFGMRTRQGGVLYLATENEKDMRKRVRVLRDRFGSTDNFHVVSDSGGRFRDIAFLERLKRLIAARRPSLIVVDTLSMAMPGFEENSSEGMGEVIAICHHLRQWGAAVLLVHHDTKAGDELPRGHSSLYGAVDMNLWLKKKDGVVRGTPTKNRNGFSGETVLAFRNTLVELGLDEDLEREKTVICEEESVAGLSSGEATGKKLTPSEKAVLENLEALTRHGKKSTTKEEWRETCIADDRVSAAEKRDDRGKAFRRALETLAGNGVYTIHGEDLEEVRLMVAPDMLDAEGDDEEALI